MSLYDETEYLDILKGYTSEDTRRARRNLSFIAFTIIIISTMNFSLADIKVLGLSFAGKDEWKMILFAAAALVYWWVIYHFHFKHDEMINNELNGIVENKKTRIVSRDDDNKLEKIRKKEAEEEELKNREERRNNPNLTGLQRIFSDLPKTTTMPIISSPSKNHLEYGPAAEKIKSQDERTTSTNNLKYSLNKVHHRVPHILASIAIVLLYWKLLVYMWVQF